MALEFFGKRGTIDGLLARKKYDKAVEAIAAQLKRGDDHRLRMQLADTLVLAGRAREAVGVLSDLADDLASEDQAAKAIAVCKKIQRIDPAQPGLDTRIAALIQTKEAPKRKAWNPANTPGFMTSERVLDFGYEDGELKPPPPPEPWTPVTRPVAPVLPPPTGFHAPPPPSWAEFGEPTPSLSSAPVAPLSPATAAPLVRRSFEDVELELIRGPHTVTLPPPSAPVPAAPVVAAEPEVEEIVEEMVEAEEVFEVYEEPPAAISPLFQGFSQDELLAVMSGLRLVTFEPGEIIITEGDPGDSLFVLTTGVAKAFVKKVGDAGQRFVREMRDGDFFGEISILSGRLRSATVTAASWCELLELDRATLDGITRVHPHVLAVLEEFYVKRASS